MPFLRKLFDALKRSRAGWYALAGSFIISSGWGYYHLSKHNVPKLLLTIFGMGVVLYAVYQLFKIFYVSVCRYFNRHPFWHNEFVGFLDEIFFVTSLFFVIFFFQSELLSTAYVVLVLLLLYWRVSFSNRVQRSCCYKNNVCDWNSIFGSNNVLSL